MTFKETIMEKEETKMIGIWCTDCGEYMGNTKVFKSRKFINSPEAYCTECGQKYGIYE